MIAKMGNFLDKKKALVLTSAFLNRVKPQGFIHRNRNCIVGDEGIFKKVGYG